MDRRHFIASAAAGALGLGLSGAAWETAPSANLQTLARPALLDMLGERRVRDLGMRYRAMYPAACDANTLCADILDGDRPPAADAPATRAYLNARIQGDFDAGRTMILKGWVLSITEARQCALFSLVYP